MTVAEPDVVMTPMMLLTTGVKARHVYVTRTEMKPVDDGLAQFEPIHAPLGGVPELATQLIWTVVTEPNGDICRFAAALMSATKAASLAGQIGPPEAPQLASVLPL